VERSARFITSDGKHVLAADDAFFARLGGVADGREPTQFAVRCLGFVKLASLDDAGAVVELCPHTVDRRALLAAELEIGLFAAAHFRIRYVDGDRSGERPLSATEAVDCLRALRPAGEAPAANPRFSAEPRDFGALLRLSANPYSLLSQKWCAAFGEINGTLSEFAAESGFLDRMVLFGVSRRWPEPVFRFIGGTPPWLDPEFGRRAIGEKLADMPDKPYGGWAAAFYAEVARRGEPRFDRVSAHRRLPAGGSYDVQYDRLLLPWRMASGETIVSLLSYRIG
jgi:hypothetical protein